MEAAEKYRLEQDILDKQMEGMRIGQEVEAQNLETMRLQEEVEEARRAEEELRAQQLAEMARREEEKELESLPENADVEMPELVMVYEKLRDQLKDGGFTFMTAFEMKDALKTFYIEFPVKNVNSKQIGRRSCGELHLEMESQIGLKKKTDTSSSSPTLSC